MYRSQWSNCFLQCVSHEGELSCVIALFQGSSLALIELTEVESFRFCAAAAVSLGKAKRSGGPACCVLESRLEPLGCAW